MSLDRFVRWKGKRPTKIEIEHSLEDYARWIGSVRWSAGRWFVTLPGVQSRARARAGAATETQRAVWAEDVAAKRERWFEVVPGSREVDVITREADEITSAIADGFVRVLVFAFGGKAEP